MSWPITLETLRISPYQLRDTNFTGLFVLDSKFFALLI